MVSCDSYSGIMWGVMWLRCDVCLFTAPSAPRSVRARLVFPSHPMVEVSWREPVETNGIISQYTVVVRGIIFLTGISGSFLLHQLTFNKVHAYIAVMPTYWLAYMLPLQTYPGHIGAANITMSNFMAQYSFQVRASNLVNGIQNHGELSQVTSESSVFIPSTSELMF